MLVVLTACMVICIGGERCSGVNRRCVCTHDWRVVSCTDQGMTSLPNITSEARRLQVEIFHLQGNAIRIVMPKDVKVSYPNLRQIDLRSQQIGGRCVKVVGHRPADLVILTDCDATTTTTRPLTTEGVLMATTSSGINSTDSDDVRYITQQPHVTAPTKDDDTTGPQTSTPVDVTTEALTQEPSRETVYQDREDIPDSIIAVVSTLATILLLVLLYWCWWALWKLTQYTRIPCNRPCTCCPRGKPTKHQRRDDDDPDAGCTAAIETLSFESVELFALPRARHSTK